VVASVTNVVTNMGFATPWMEQSDDAIGLAVTGSGLGVCVLRSKATGQLRYSTWNGSDWFPGFGASLFPLGAGGAIAVAGPAVAASNDKGHAVYQGTDLKYYYAEESNFMWNPANELITSGGKDAEGPAAPALVVLGQSPVVAFIGKDGDLYDQTRMAGVWQAAVPHGVAGQPAAAVPAMAVLTQGPELVLVFADAAAHALHFTTRTAGVWSVPAAIAGATSDDPVSLAPLAMGGAVLAYRGKDSHLSTALLAADGATWSAPVAGVSGAATVLVSPPAVATGAKGADAELIYLDAAYIVYSSRLINGTFGAASLFSTGGARLAIATGLPEAN
jgi:hypothetical protein